MNPRRVCGFRLGAALEVGEGGGFGGVGVEEGEEAGDFEGATEVGVEMSEANVAG